MIYGLGSGVAGLRALGGAVITARLTHHPRSRSPPGQAIGYVFYSRTPRSQATDISIIAHRVPVIVNWVDSEEFEAVFRWPAKDDDWPGSTAYHAIVMPFPPRSPDTPAGYESQHSVELSSARYEVLIGQGPHTIGTELESLTWSTD